MAQSSSLIVVNMDGRDSNKYKIHRESEYEKVREQLLSEGAKQGRTFVYADQNFPATIDSLYKKGMEAPMNYDYVRWLRPHRFTSQPKLVKGGTSSEDIVQGMLGNCWWLSACASICQSKERMKIIIPAGQSCYGEPEYTGIFRFRFWQFGKWVEVCVDDRLPHLEGKLCFARSSCNSEYWICLLEKAYSKLMGCYFMCESGQTNEALEDLTGGLAVTIKLKENTPPDFQKRLLKAMRTNTFVAAGVSSKGGSGEEGVDNNSGLVSGHVYSVLGAFVLQLKNGEYEFLVKVKNPWGDSFEWKGPYCDGSAVWDQVTDEDKKRIGYVDKDNGEWFMTYIDFVCEYDDVTMCTIGPDFDGDGEPTGDSWLSYTIKGIWTKDENAGGSLEDVNNYAKNPQYLIELTEPDDFDADHDDAEDEGKCSLVIGLMQNKRPLGLKNEFMAMHLWHDANNGNRLDAEYFNNNREVMTCDYADKREVTSQLKVDPGRYVLVPSVYDVGSEGEFLVRIFSEKKISVKEIL